MRLFTVEVRRLLARRTFRFLTAGVLLFLVVLVGGIAWNSQPPTAEELAFAVEQVELEKEYIAEEMANCEANPSDFGVSGAAECEDVFGGWVPTVENYTYSSTFSFADEITTYLAPIGAALFLFALVTGVSFVGAEWSSGMMGTHLTWEPRRGRVLATKTLAVTVIVAVLTAIFVTAALLALYWVAATWGTTDRTTDEVVTAVVTRGLRITALAAALGAFGVAVAGVLRSTVGGLVLVGAYLGIVEGVVRAVWTGSDRWLLSHNVVAWLDDGFEHHRWECSRLGECTDIVTRITLAGGAAVLGTVILAGVVLHTATFLRRDVV